MDDSTPKKASIPSWQLAATPDKPASPPDADDQKQQDQPPTPKETLLTQASEFLQDESIRDAPTDKKIAFLESKGLDNDDIHRLLGVSKNREATASNGDNHKSQTETITTQDTTSNNNEPASSVHQTQTAPPPASSNTPTSTTTSSSPPRRDIPPVITYPEFIVQESNPPLVNLKSVLYTLYGAAGVAATVYGASEYLVKPMLETLTGSRHELAETATANLHTLNEKLQSNVSTIPPLPAKKSQHGADSSHDQDTAGEVDEDVESITSDPTELYHRDIATQTTPDLSSASTTTPTSADAQPSPPDQSDSEKTITAHSARLHSITSQLKDVLSIEEKTDSSHGNARDRISELNSYLDTLTYSSPMYMNSTLYTAFGEDSSSSNKKGGATAGEDEAISSFRAEVRSVKGTLLSARNFPSGYRRGTSVR